MFERKLTPSSGVQRQVAFESIRRGIMVGLVFATIYIAYVLLLYAFRGRAPFDAVGVSLGGVVAAYVAGGISGGAVFGLLRPFIRNRSGASGAGFMIAFPIWIGIGTVTSGYPWRWQGGEWAMCIILSLAFGVVLGNIFWSMR